MPYHHFTERLELLAEDDLERHRADLHGHLFTAYQVYLSTPLAKNARHQGIAEFFRQRGALEPEKKTVNSIDGDALDQRVREAFRRKPESEVSSGGI